MRQLQWQACQSMTELECGALKRVLREDWEIHREAGAVLVYSPDRRYFFFVDFNVKPAQDPWNLWEERQDAQMYEAKTSNGRAFLRRYNRSGVSFAEVSSKFK